MLTPSQQWAKTPFFKRRFVLRTSCSLRKLWLEGTNGVTNWKRSIKSITHRGGESGLLFATNRFQHIYYTSCTQRYRIDYSSQKQPIPTYSMFWLRRSVTSFFKPSTSSVSWEWETWNEPTLSLLSIHSIRYVDSNLDFSRSWFNSTFNSSFSFFNCWIVSFVSWESSEMTGF